MNIRKLKENVQIHHVALHNFNSACSALINIVPENEKQATITNNRLSEKFPNLVVVTRKVGSSVHVSCTGLPTHRGQSSEVEQQMFENIALKMFEFFRLKCRSQNMYFSSLRAMSDNTFCRWFSSQIKSIRENSIDSLASENIQSLWPFNFRMINSLMSSPNDPYYGLAFINVLRTQDRLTLISAQVDPSNELFQQGQGGHIRATELTKRDLNILYRTTRRSLIISADSSQLPLDSCAQGTIPINNTQGLLLPELDKKNSVFAKCSSSLFRSRSTNGQGTKMDQSLISQQLLCEHLQFATQVLQARGPGLTLAK